MFNVCTQSLFLIITLSILLSIILTPIKGTVTKRCKPQIFIIIIILFNVIGINTKHTQSLHKYNDWEDMSSYSILPRKSIGMAVGYDNETIWLLGGWRLSRSVNQQLISFKNGTFEDHGINNLTERVHADAQSYTQMGSYLYIMKMKYDGSHILRFNLHTVRIESLSTNIPKDVGYGRFACLASYNGYLYIIGGYNNGVYLADTQIYNVVTDKWLLNIPSLNMARRGHACIIHNNILYAIGGLGYNGAHKICLDSIEILSITDPSNIHNKHWSFISTLNTPISGSRAVVYGSDILILGGEGHGYYANEINVIDTITNKVSIKGYLDIGLDTTAAIIVNDTAYLFGGKSSPSSNGILSSWRRKILPVPSPINKGNTEILGIICCLLVIMVTIIYLKKKRNTNNN
eukprot:107732_1